MMTARPIRLAVSLCVLAVVTGGAQQPDLRPGEVLVRLETTLGTIDLAIDTKNAPITAANFLKYVDGGFYDGGRFHRATRADNYTPVPPEKPMMEIVQAGIDPARRREGFDPIPLERTSVTGLKHVVGTVSMARTPAADSARSDFFICLDDQPSLDFGGKRFDDAQGAAAFGRVVRGMDVVRKIQQQPVEKQALTPPIAITRASRVSGGSDRQSAETVKVTLLSTMLVGAPANGMGEWGFAAVVEVGERRLLVDTGARAETVLRNAAELKVDLAAITDVVLTHNHADHTGGLLTLRRELARTNPAALSRVHVPKGIFYPRPGSDGREGNGLLPIRAQYEATGGVFVEHAGPVALMPGVTMLGPVPRVHPERNFGDPRGGAPGRVQTPDGLVEDTVPEDTSVVVDTGDGLVLLSGCGHSGIVNAMEFARKAVRVAPVHTVIGGFHLFAASDDVLTWTAERLRQFGVRHLLGAHCTGIEAVYRLRALAGLTRQTAIVGAVGASYTHGRGFESTPLAR
jgi:7,8-dihydropterin-6-yl-methyl-4-(beta-D-ribofuranosyl)aminobenzene 5'-phosphate synthase